MAQKNKKLLFITKVAIATYLVIATALTILTLFTKNQKITQTSKNISLTPELARAMTYEQFTEGSDDVYSTDGETKVDNVKFSAFFLRDLDNDGYAEKIKGTCKEIGSQDTLYMEINVLTNGKLTDAKIEVDGKNFYLQTVLPKDQQIKNNVIGTNVKRIEFNEMVNGTQKLLTGVVRSGDYSYSSLKQSAIGNNINNYTRDDNKIILTGTYIDENNNETPIRKEIPLTVDWYGQVRAEIPSTIAGMKNTYQDYETLQTAIDRENETLNLNFTIGSYETKNELLLKDTKLTATIPEFNGYAPTKVEVTNPNINYTYDEETKKLVITKESTTTANGEIDKICYDGTYGSNRYNIYNVKITYPIEAYDTLGADTIQIRIPIEAYYEGYNNQNTEFNNPYKSNTATATIVAEYSNPRGTAAIFKIYTGEYMYEPTRRYVVSKQKPLKIYNDISSEEHNDIYTVEWRAYTGTDGESSGIIMKETKDGQAQVSDEFIKADSTSETMENVTTNIGIAFSNASNMLGDDGWIKVYDEETGTLLETFDKTTWNRYTKRNPYMYEN